MMQPSEIWSFTTPTISQAFVFDSLPSTNDRATFADIPPGSMVLAHHQTQGRGQSNRVWQSPEGQSLLASVVVQPPTQFNRPVILTAWAAVSISQAIREMVGISPRIKWPNDLLIDGQKVCGILIEQSRSTIVGFGLNLQQTRDDFTQQQLPQATSLRLISGRMVDLRTAVEMVVQQLDLYWQQLDAGHFRNLESAWRHSLGFVGRQVLVELTSGEFQPGRVHDMSFAGLELDLGSGVVSLLAPESIRHITPT